jgi:hypothetical protein
MRRFTAPPFEGQTVLEYAMGINFEYIAFGSDPAERGFDEYGTPVIKLNPIQVTNLIVDVLESALGIRKMNELLGPDQAPINPAVNLQFETEVPGEEGDGDRPVNCRDLFR